MAAIVSYDSEPTTLSRSQGSGTPRSFASVMTLMTMATAGAMVKTPAVTAMRLSFSGAMPIALPRLHAFTRKYTDCASTAAIMSPAMANSMGLFTLNSNCLTQLSLLIYSYNNLTR